MTITVAADPSEAAQPDAQTLSMSGADVRCLELAAFDTPQQGLAGHAVGHGFEVARQS
jgi:hypothetical protein